MTNGFKLWAPVIALVALMAVGTTLSVVVDRGVMTEISQVSVSGDITVNQRNAVYRLLSDHAALETPIRKLQQVLEEKPWVRLATVERRWPDTLLVAVVPEQPIALWNDDAYLNDEGEVFTSPFVNQARLPQLYGPVGKEAEVMAQYQQLNTTLFRVGQNIETLTLGTRQSWRLKTDAGIEVLLGKTAFMERVQRLLRVTEYIDQQGRLGQVDQIDTRYGNGVAVAWKDEEQGSMNVATNYNSQREAKL